MKAFPILFCALLLPAAAPAQRTAPVAASRVTAADGMLFVLRESRGLSSRSIDRFPRVGHVCIAPPSFVVHSGWFLLRGSNWVVVDSVSSCPGDNPAGYRLDARVDSGLVSGTPDGPGLILMRGRTSPLPGPAAVVQWHGARSKASRMGDTIMITGPGPSDTFVYVRVRYHSPAF